MLNVLQSVGGPPGGRRAAHNGSDAECQGRRHAQNQSSRLTRMFLYRTTLLGSCAWRPNVPSLSLLAKGLPGSLPSGSVYSITVFPSIFTVIFLPSTMISCVHHFLSCACDTPVFTTL